MDFLRREIDVNGRILGARLGRGADRGRGALGRLLVFARDDRRGLISAGPHLRQGEHDQAEDCGCDDDDEHEPSGAGDLEALERQDVE